MLKNILNAINAYFEKQRLEREFIQACKSDHRFIKEFAAIQARQEEVEMLNK